MTDSPDAPDAPIAVPNGEEVTTEPQRRALEDMSADLTRKLNAMVAEQEERVRIFAAQHHSLSPSPSAPDAPFPMPEAPQAAEPWQQEPWQQEEPPSEGLVGLTQPAITNGPKLPARRRQDAVPPAPPKPSRFHRPVTFPPREKKESSIGSGFVTVILFIVFIIVHRSCK